MEKLERPICMEVIATSNLLRRAMAEQKKSSYDIGGVQHWVLGFIHRHQGIRPIFQKNIEQVFQLSPSSASELLQKMEGQGLITRRPMKEDGRLKEILISPKGAQAGIQSREILRAFDKQIEQTLSEEENQTLRSLLSKVRENTYPLVEKKKKGDCVHD